MPHYEKCGKNARDQPFRLGMPDPHRQESVMTLYAVHYNDADMPLQVIIYTIDGDD
jgi:hypothetical protein